MATHVFYERAAKSALDGDFTLLTSNIKIYLIRIGAGHYVADFTITGDQFLSAIAVGDRVSSSANLTSKVTALSGTGGIFDADDTVFPLVPAGAACGAIVWVQDTGTPSTSRLICYVDDYAGLPYTPTGADANVAFPAGGHFQI